MNKLLPTAAALIVAAVLQVGIAPHVAIGGVVPNLLLLVVITLAMIEGPRSGATAGFVAGLLFDLLGTGPIGPMAMVLAMTGHLAGSLSANMFAEGWLMPLTVVFVASVGAEFVYAILLAVLGEGGSLGATLWTISLPGALYDAVLALLIYPVLARFLRREQTMRTFRRLA